MLIALDIPPGIYRNGTEYSSQGRYYDANLVRFHEGSIGPVGGWVARSLSAVEGAARTVMPWLSNSSQAWTAVGTSSGLYAVSRSGAVSDITPVDFVAGRADAIVAGGYGEGLYGVGLYGTPRLGTTGIIPASVWSLDSWGEYLVGTMGETIYEWRLDTAVVAAPIANAPDAAAILVTAERIMMALGSDGDPRAVDWCDAEDNTDWTPSATDLAGGKRLQTNGKLQCGRKMKAGSLIWSDVDVHTVTYTGLPFVYAFNQEATGCGVISKGAVAVVNDEAMWMGTEKFWAYRGGVVPLPCDVEEYVFGDINRTQVSKVSAFHNSLKGEVWWLYPSADSDEVDRYVYFSYRHSTPHWNIGAIDRLCGAGAGVLALPQMVGSDGLVYNHETGALKDEAAPFLTSGPSELGQGDRTMEVHGYLPDTINTGDVSLTLSVRDYPGDAATSFGPFSTTAKTDLRLSGRTVAMTLTGPVDADFRVGSDRFDVKPGSGR